MPVSSTRAGMRNYVPRRQGMSMDTVTGPEERAKRAMMIRQAKEDEMDKAAQTAQAMPPAMKKGGMVKKRRFAEGGGTTVNEDPIGGIADFYSQKVPSKSKVVTKEELAKSGLSLRDYMNKQRGLKRRGEKNPTLGEAKDKNAQAAADAIDPGDIRTRELGRTRGGPSYDSVGKPSNAGPDVEYKGTANTRTGAPAIKDKANAPSKESMMQRRSQYEKQQEEMEPSTFRKGGAVMKYARGGGIEQRGKTRGKIC